jgi:predicted ATPase
MFTDIEGSTRLQWQLGDHRFLALIAEHDGMLGHVIDAQGGVVVKGLGDGLFAAFGDSARAIDAAAEVERVVAAHSWPDLVDLRVRVGLHAGEAQIQGRDYVAIAATQAARVVAAAHGGQALVTKTVVASAGPDCGLELTDLGEHRLKDFAEPVWLYQLGSARFPPLRTVSNTNLPRPASLFVGRATEMMEVARLFRDGARLVTLTGPGGSGKTRLAVEAGIELVADFKAGAFWVDLAQLRDPKLVPAAIATTLGARTGLAEHIGERDLLLVLDNLEQVISAAPELASLIESCPGLRLLITSRERMKVRGEIDYPVGPLTEEDAVALFFERARVEPTVLVRQLCRALDRLPLAVELAAARARILPVEQIIARLGDRLDSLRGGRDANPRQETLRATIAWSYDLLDGIERDVFARLAVFAGGCTLDAAEDVAQADLDTLASLIDKSLVEHADDRFSMLETIREFAAERLQAARDGDWWRRRHAEWFLELAQVAADQLHTVDQGTWLERLRAEIDNFRTVLRWSLEEDIRRGLQLANALLLPWTLHGRLPELVSWYRHALTATPLVDPLTQAVSLRCYGTALNYCEHFVEAQQRLDQSLGLYRQHGDELGEASVLNLLGSVAANQGDPGSARELRERALAIFRRHGDQRGIADSLHLIGMDLRDAGDLDRATSLLEEATHFYLTRGDRRAAMTLMHSLGDVALDARDLVQARKRYLESLAIADDLGDLRNQSYCLAGLASVAALENDSDDASRLWTAAQSFERRLGVTMVTRDRVRYERVLGRVAVDPELRITAEATDLSQAIIRGLLKG